MGLYKLIFVAIRACPRSWRTKNEAIYTDILLFKSTERGIWNWRHDLKGTLIFSFPMCDLYADVSAALCHLFLTSSVK